jgi:hypothetical protein
MIDMVDKEWSVTKVKDMPNSAFRGIKAPYEEILDEIENSPVGIYEVKLASRKPNTVYLGLKSALKDRQGLRVHKRLKQIFIQRLP